MAKKKKQTLTNFNIFATFCVAFPAIYDFPTEEENTERKRHFADNVLTILHSAGVVDLDTCTINVIKS
jgi:hypothetical protein